MSLSRCSHRQELRRDRGAAGVDLDIEPRKTVGLMGDNGAGRSTLVKIIAGNFPRSAGTIEMEGKTSTSIARSTPGRSGSGRPTRTSRWRTA